jgi:TatA/E family protein of Tat protein translocase
MPQIGPLEIAMVLLVALVVFGPTKLPELGKQAARGLREFRQFQSGLRSDLAGMFDADERDDDDDHDPDVLDVDAHEPDPPRPVTAGSGSVEAGADDEEASQDASVAPEASSGEAPPADASQ